MDIPLLHEVQTQLSRFTKAFRRWQFGNKQQLAFLEDLYLLVNDGIPANRAVEMIAQVTRGLTHEVALSITEKIGEGQQLADGMAEWFSPNVVEIIRVGEAGGALAQTMKSAINNLSQRGVAMGSFVGAMAYPLLVLVMACSIIVYLKSSVFVQFEAIKPIEQWPAAGQRLVAIGGIIQHWWWLVLLLIGLFTFFLFKMMANYIGEFRGVLDQYPPFSIYRRLVAARMLETLGLLVANGVVFKVALRVMQYQANPYLLSHLMLMEHLLSTGRSNIADVLATGLIDNNDLMRLRVMAEVKGFEHGLVRMGVKGAEQTTDLLKFVSRIVGGIFLAFGGLLVILIMQGIYLTGMAMGTQ